MAKNKDNDTAPAEDKPDNSIIPKKYRNNYKGASDWIGEFIDGQCRTKGENDKDEGLNPSLLCDLAAANHVKEDKVAHFRGDIGKKNAPGRLRMTIGNMLRAAARKRHGLFDLNGDWVDAPDTFIGDAPKVQNPDGSKIQTESEDESEKETEDA